MTAILLALTLVAGIQDQRDHQHHAALKERGKQFMGFDQDATTHRFILTKTGGRIEVTARAASDTRSTGQIRDHLRGIAAKFTAGDFSIPALVHEQKVPGVEKMKGSAAALTFIFEEIDRGARVNIAGATPEAIAAVHEFLRFQIKDHGTGDPVVVK